MPTPSRPARAPRRTRSNHAALREGRGDPAQQGLLPSIKARGDLLAARVPDRDRLRRAGSAGLERHRAHGQDGQVQGHRRRRGFRRAAPEAGGQGRRPGAVSLRDSKELATAGWLRSTSTSRPRPAGTPGSTSSPQADFPGPARPARRTQPEPGPSAARTPPGLEARTPRGSRSAAAGPHAKGAGSRRGTFATGTTTPLDQSTRCNNLSLAYSWERGRNGDPDRRPPNLLADAPPVRAPTSCVPMLYDPHGYEAAAATTKDLRIDFTEAELRQLQELRADADRAGGSGWTTMSRPNRRRDPPGAMAAVRRVSKIDEHNLALTSSSGSPRGEGSVEGLTTLYRAGLDGPDVVDRGPGAGLVAARGSQFPGTIDPPSC